MDPRNHNPFRTDTSGELKSEYAANRELVKTRDNETRRMVRSIFEPMKTDELGFWK